MISSSEIDTLINDLLENMRFGKFQITQMYSLISTAVGVLSHDPIVLRLTTPLKICGDVHGQLNDLIKVFRSGGMPPESKYLFLGDYVDRGPQSLEVICLLYALKIKYPTSVYLIRGNHESPEMSEVFGFYSECCAKATANTWHKFCDSFRYLPLAAIVDNKYFCIHGGLSPDFKSIDQIEKVKRPMDIPEEGLLANVLWSDPSPSIKTWGPNDRGTTVCYGPEAVKKFLKDNGLEMIIRGHQLAQKGFDFPYGSNKSVCTIFTASKYAGQCDNKAAYITIENDEMKFTTLPTKNPLPAKINQPGTPRKRAKRVPFVF